MHDVRLTYDSVDGEWVATFIDAPAISAAADSPTEALEQLAVVVEMMGGGEIWAW